VVLIQPLLVLAVPISLPVGWLLGRAWPSPSGWTQAALGCLAVVGGLGVFFLLVGDPGSGSELQVTAAAWTAVIALVVTALGSVAVRGRPSAVRAGVLGALAGALFGVVGVLLNAVATVYDDHGPAALQNASGWVPLAGLLALGAVAFVLTQVSFQIGELAASFPANESSAPIVAVIVGALLLHETVPMSAWRLPLYVICLVAVVIGTVVLARPHAPVGNNERR
jgi:drug/metabolite transporter (DMT)-like permease